MYKIEILCDVYFIIIKIGGGGEELPKRNPALGNKSFLIPSWHSFGGSIWE